MRDEKNFLYHSDEVSISNIMEKIICVKYNSEFIRRIFLKMWNIVDSISFFFYFLFDSFLDADFITNVGNVFFM